VLTIDGVAPVSSSRPLPDADSICREPQYFLEWDVCDSARGQLVEAAGWAIFIFATLKKKSWATPVGIFAATMSMLAGYPLGLHNALVEVHRFSMFLPAPIMSTGLLIYLLLPSTQKMLEAWNLKG
jgi:hypothetical protein